MTNKEAIEIIKNYDVYGCGYCHQGSKEIEEAFKMAIDVLEQTQLIDGDRAVSLNDVIATIYDSLGNFKNEFDQGFFADKIRVLPPVTLQTGHWIYSRCDMYECSKCGMTYTDLSCGDNMADFCPFCGSYNGGNDNADNN